MRRTLASLLLPFAAIVLAADPPAPAEAPTAPTGLIVHEWGTFTEMQGTDGVVLDGLHHEEEQLPDFVYDRSRNPEMFTGVRTKMETPVTYFYAAESMTAQVSVRFPRGLLTQWYPMASTLAPALAKPGETIALEGGELVWKDLVLLAANDRRLARVKLPVTRADDPWNHAREVDAMIVKAFGNNGCQWEKMLFYRGLGQIDLPVVVTAQGHGRFAVTNTDARAVTGAIAIEVKDGVGAFSVLGTIAGRGQTELVAPMSTQPGEPLAAMVPRLQRALVEILAAEGLYGKEAWAMVRTWSTSYFHTPGLRILYCLPQSLTDAAIPLSVSPAPTETVRVMVARLECLTPEHEAAIEGSVVGLGDAAFAVREQALRELHALGRFAEPNLRRVMSRTADPEVRARARRLLDFLAPSR